MKKLFVLLSLLGSYVYAAPVSYIQSRSTLQSGTTFYVSSGTVAGKLTVTSTSTLSMIYDSLGARWIYNGPDETNFYAGHEAGTTSGTQGYNTGVGHWACGSVDDAHQMVCVGDSAGSSVIHGFGSVYIGQESGTGVSTSTGMVAVGLQTLPFATGPYSSALGSTAGASVTTASSGTYIGAYAGQGVTGSTATTTGPLNTYLGYNTRQGAVTQLTNAGAIGANAVVSTSDTIQIGAPGVLTSMSSAAISGLSSGQCVQTGTGGLLTVTGSACGAGGSGSGIVSPGTFTWVNTSFGVTLGTVTASGTVTVSSHVVITSSNNVPALKVTANGADYGTTIGTSGGFLHTCPISGTQGMCAQFYSNAGTQSNLAGVVNILSGTAYDSVTLYIQAAGTDPENGIRVDGSDYSTIALIDTLRSGSSKNGKYQFSSHNNQLRGERRNAANNAFESAWTVDSSTGAGIMYVGTGYLRAVSTMDVAGGMSVGSAVAGVTASPFNGLLVQGSVTINSEQINDGQGFGWIYNTGSRSNFFAATGAGVTDGTGTGDTGIGNNALGSLTTASQTSAFGAEAGSGLAAGTGVTLLGYGTSAVESLTNATAIGQNAVVSTSQTIRMGVSGTLVSMSTFTASSGTVTTLNVTSIKYADGTVQVSSPSASGAGGSGVTVYPATATIITPYGITSTTGVYTSTVTVAALSVNGDSTKNLYFIGNNDSVNYQIIGSSVVATKGQLAVYGSSNSIVVSSFTNTLLALDGNGLLVSTPTPSGGAGTPGGSTGQIQYNSAGSFAGITSAVTASSVTIIRSSFSFTANGIQNTLLPAGIFDFFGNTGYVGQPLLSVGSDNAQSKFVVYDRAPTLASYGITAGELQLGHTANRIGTINTSSSFFDLYNGDGVEGEMLFQTGAAVTRDIVFKPEAIETVRLSSGVMTVQSSATFVSLVTVSSATQFNGTILISSAVKLSGASGTSGQVLTSGGAGTIPSWTTPSGGGSSALAVATGSAAGFTTPSSSPTAVINFSSSSFSSALTGGATAFVSLLTTQTFSSMTVIAEHVSTTTVGILNFGNAFGSDGWYGNITSGNMTLGNSASLGGGQITLWDLLDAGEFTLYANSVISANSSLAISAATSMALSATSGISQTTTTFSGLVTAASSSSFTGGIDISSSVKIVGLPGVSGQVFTSSGPGTRPYWSNAGVGNAVLSATQTWTGQNNWTTPAQSTFTYGLTVGSLTISGSGAGAFYATEGSAPSGVAGTDILYGSSASNWLRMIPNNGANYFVVGSSNSPNTGEIATWSGSGSLIGTKVLTSSITFTDGVNISTSVKLSGSAGTNGQVFTSGGPNTIPTWTTPTGGSSVDTFKSSFTYTFNPDQAKLPATNSCVISNSTNSYTSSLLCDAAANERVWWSTTLNQYQGGTITIDVYYTMASATSNSTVFVSSVACISAGDSEDVDVPSFAVGASSATIVPGTAGYMRTATITPTGDSCAAGDIIIVYVERQGASASDTATADAEIRKVRVYEP